MKHMARCIFYVLAAGFCLISGSSHAFAQLVPKGIGAVQVGYSRYGQNLKYFDENGTSRAQGNKITTDFSAKSMASGKAGSDLQRLYNEMKKFESQGVSKGVADDMDFGRVTGDVKTSIEAQYLGAAYGLTDDWTFTLGIPFVRASISTTMQYSGNNNAAEIKNRLGNLIYREMQEGLDTAANMSIQNIRDDIQVKKGYKSLDEWSYSGLGDIQIGARTMIRGSSFGLRSFNLGLQGLVELATGHENDPDSLIDISIGRGYHAFTFSSDAKFSESGFELGLQSFVTQGLGRDTVRRVPLGDDALPGIDRRTNVFWQPGQDLGAAVYVGYGTDLLSGSYKIGANQHLRDSYRGSLEGNYAALEKASESNSNYQEISLTVSTVKSYLQKQTAVPVIAKLTFHDTFAGQNTTASQYVELSLTSFFSTPAAASQGKQPTPKMEQKQKYSRAFSAN